MFGNLIIINFTSYKFFLWLRLAAHSEKKKEKKGKCL